MYNIFFVKDRCPLSLSLAGYFMNKGEKCVEILEKTVWIIPSDDERRLCYAAANVIEILKNNHVHRVFVQGGSKNIDAIILASILSALDIYVIDTREGSATIIPSLLDFATQLFTTEQTKMNFLQSESTEDRDEHDTDENEVQIYTHFPPEKNWFYVCNFFSVVPANEYSKNNYALPNYVEPGLIIDPQQRAQALKISQFFKYESCSSWLDFENLFLGVEKHDNKD